MDDQAAQNTDRELWRGPDEGSGSYYADSIHVTKEGNIGINCGGLVHVRPLREWHALASLWRCEGCGSMKSIEQIRGEHPEAIACCPDRKMMPPFSRGPK